MNILLLGSGGREHALAYKISQSPHCTKLFIAPGNPGTEKHGENVPINILDFNDIEKFVLHNGIDMMVVGPEEPLVKGIFDFFENSDQVPSISIIGPSAAGAMLEGSKQFAKEFMQRHSIPSAAYASFTLETIDEAHSYLEKHTVPVVLKADGLAAGKGVLVCETVDAAHLQLDEMLKGKFGNASTK
ncbi:MAG: phosphoribosylamine--glycine ligase, partial [Chitinophagales bacterium]|nr:phosphoribosylamine--glycine ligase [Chitinophagales bacterium]